MTGEAVRAGASPRLSSMGLQTLVARAGAHLLVGAGSALVARELGADGRGRYFLAVTIAVIAFHVANMGLEQAQFRMWSRRLAKPDDLVTSAALFAFGLGVAAVAFVWLLYALGPASLFRGTTSLDLAVVLLVVPVLIHSLLVTGLLVVVGELPRVNVAVLLGAVAQAVGLGALFVVDRLTVTTALALYVVNYVVPWLLLLRALRRVGRVRRPIPWRLMAAQLRFGAQYEPSILFYYLNLRLDVIFVQRYLDLASVGIYSIAVLLAEVIWLVTDSVSWSVRERQANAPHDEAVEVSVRAVRMTLLLSFLVAVAIAVVAPLGIPLVFGQEFAPATAVVWVLLPAVGGMAVWKVLGPLLVRLLSPWTTPALSGFALAVNVAANVVLIPRVGIVGAGLASTVSYWSGAVLAVFCLARGGHLDPRRLVPGTTDVRQIVSLVEDRVLSLTSPRSARRGGARTGGARS